MLSTAQLPRDLKGQVLTPEAHGYDDARTVFAAHIDRRPALIARVQGVDDIARLIAHARETGSELAIRSGGHSPAGHGVCDGGIVIDLSALRSFELDGAGRTAWFSGDVERTYWQTGHGDLLRLIHNALRWLTRDERMVIVEGSGLVEMFCWETDPGYAVHLLNYTNPNTHHGWMQSVIKLGPQRVRVNLPSGVRVSAVDLLRAETSIPFELHGQDLSFTIPSLDDYEVAAITISQ